jgi:arylformamidase
VGEAMRLDFRHKRAGEMVTIPEIEERGADIRAGDMLLFDFDCAKLYRTPHSHDRPSIAHDAIRWLVLEKRISLIGTDASGIELKGVPDQPNHQFLMDHGVPIIESAANFGELRLSRFTLFVLALSVVGLDSCPVRLLAVEEEEE